LKPGAIFIQALQAWFSLIGGPRVSPVAIHIQAFQACLFYLSFIQITFQEHFFYSTHSGLFLAKLVSSIGCTYGYSYSSLTGLSSANPQFIN